MSEKNKFDLEKRTQRFAKDVRIFAKKIKISIVNYDDIKQLLRSSGSIGANYIEANEALSRKDFFYRIKICLKESKESKYWLGVIDVSPISERVIYDVKKNLFNESSELLKIFASIKNSK